jgi:uncharacterized protein (TIGR02246 family)
MWKLCFISGVVLLFGVAVYAQKVTDKQRVDKQPADASEAIRATLKSYGEAFNKNDAQAVAAFWGAKAVYVDRASGERAEGRGAIQADFEKLFKEQRGVRLTATVGSVRFIKPDVAMVDGVATVFRSNEEPNEASFSAVLVKEGARWLIDSVTESDTPAPPSAGEALKELEFLVGQWRDKSEDVRVDTTVRWSDKRSFLVRSYTVERDDDTHQGTQIIGWDPRGKRIRSWTFDSDGSFGEETWSKVDGDWVIKMTRTLADGGTASGAQVLAQKDDNTLTVQAIAREIDGEPAPSGNPVTVERVRPMPSAKGEVPAKPATKPAASPAR